MSKEPPTAALPGPVCVPPLPPPPPHSPLAVPSTTTVAVVGAAVSSSSSVVREYGRGNWSLQETLALITAKKLDNERRSLSPSSSSRNPSHGRTGGGQLRWKWIENYCYARGCLRSQNQCNDRWDNLLRDYKKVLEHESRAAHPHSSSHPHHPLPSYWNMERHERRDHGLPANLSLEIFQKLDDVVHRSRPHLPSPSTPIPISIPAARLPPPPPVAAPATVSEASDSSETEDRSDKPGYSGRKRRKKRSVGSSIVRGASVLARTLQRCEEKEEKRHRETMELEQRRLRIEEHHNEVIQQTFSAFAAAVDTLSAAIQSLVPDSHARSRS